MAYGLSNLDACPRAQIQTFDSAILTSARSYTDEEITETYNELRAYVDEELVDPVIETIRLKDPSSSAFINAFRTGNIASFTRPIETTTNFDILAGNR